MPLGIFLIVHDEMMGPKIKSSYFKIPFELPQEFVSKLYMSHAGFKTASYLEMKFDHYKAVSYFTGHLARQTQNESILGIVFDEEETFNNLELFLKRHLNNGLIEKNGQEMKDIFQELLKHLELGRYFEKFEIQNISAIMIVTGTDEFKSCLLNIGAQVSNMEIGAIYRDMLKEGRIPKIEYLKLNLNTESNYFLVFQLGKTFRSVKKILLILATYFEFYFEYSLELMALFLLPNLLKLSPLKTQLYKKYPDNQPLLQILQKARNYQKEFNNILRSMMNNEVYPIPITT